MEAYIRQKRATPGMIQASDLQMRPISATSGSTASMAAAVAAAAASTGGGGGTNSHRNGRHTDIHGYDGPMQFMMSPNNPDQLLPTSAPISPNSEGQYYTHSQWLVIYGCLLIVCLGSVFCALKYVYMIELMNSGNWEGRLCVCVHGVNEWIVYAAYNHTMGCLYCCLFMIQQQGSKQIALLF